LTELPTWLSLQKALFLGQAQGFYERFKDPRMLIAVYQFKSLLSWLQMIANSVLGGHHHHYHCTPRLNEIRRFLLVSKRKATSTGLMA
jgi:hypothetical protein